METFFPTAQNSFWTGRFWCLLVLPHFLFHPFRIGKTFPFEDFFHLGNKKKSFGVRLGEQGGWGMGVMPFLVKNCRTLSAVWVGVLINHPSWNGQTHWKSLQKKSLKLNTASHNNASWYMITDGFLEHSLNRGSLFYMPPPPDSVFFDPCHICYIIYI